MGRIAGTLGEDADLTSTMIRAMVRGFQGDALGPSSVALIVKHFPGGGPADDGHDSHFAYGKFDVYPGGHFDYHVRPFKAAIDAGAAEIMPYYSIPKGITNEPVGNAFNREIVTDLLRGKLGFKGVVNSDSGITTSMVWGVENLTVEQRYRKAIDAGTDVFSNDATPEDIVNLARKGEVAESRIDESARRILRVRFALGIFENPYADPEVGARTVRSAEFEAKALAAQRQSIVLLANGKDVLPLRAGARVFLQWNRTDRGRLARPGRGGDAPGRGGVRAAGGAGRGPGRGRRVEHRRRADSDWTFPRDQVEKLATAMRARPTVVALYLDWPVRRSGDCSRGGGPCRPLRRRRRGATRHPHRRSCPGGQAAVRDALVDGGGPRAKGRRAVRTEDLCSRSATASHTPPPGRSDDVVRTPNIGPGGAALRLTSLTAP